jgi:hypothetical protein
MPKTVKAKLLLGNMPKAEALKTLSFCEFSQPLSENDATALWEGYRAKTNNLPLREAASPLPQQLTAKEQKIVANFMKDMKQRPTGPYLSKVIKVDPRDLAIHQFMVITERSQEYAKKMNTEENRALQCLGVGTEFRGQFPVRKVGATTIVELPHAEYIVQGMPNGFNFIERDRYISAVEAGKRLLLWGGYHRTYAVLSQMSPDGAGGAPLLTLMTGVAEVAAFFSDRCTRPAVRDTVVGPRPALFRDFFNPDLFMEVNLRKQRYEMHIRPAAPIVAPGMFRCDPVWANDES